MENGTLLLTVRVYTVSVMPFDWKCVLRNMGGFAMNSYTETKVVLVNPFIVFRLN